MLAEIAYFTSRGMPRPFVSGRALVWALRGSFGTRITLLYVPEEGRASFANDTAMVAFDIKREELPEKLYMQMSMGFSLLSEEEAG